MDDLIIIGAGPAGLTAAIYALRNAKKVLILESLAVGGQIINASSVENYPGIKNISGLELSKNMQEQVTSLGGIIKFETVLRITKEKEVITKENKYQAKAIIIATGAKNKKLGLPNEDNFLGKGLSYCATCDGNFFKDKIVAVVGGGNTAVDDALYLSNLAKHVFLIHRRDIFKAELTKLNLLKEKANVEFKLNTNVTNLIGENTLEKIELNKKEIIEVDGLFIAIGQIPNNEIFKNVVSLDKYGYIISKDGVHTKTKGIYVAGDARVKTLRQLTTAVSDGALASSIALEEMF